MKMHEKETPIVSETLPVTRRDVLRSIWVGLGGLAALELGMVTLAYMQPRLAEGEFGNQITVGAVEDFPPGSVTHIPNGRFYLVRLDDGGFVALYQRCTHLGCNVPWDQAAQRFICPCHSSQFTLNGEVENPPAPRPLDVFLVTIQDGQIVVDTRQPIQRQEFDPSQVAYA
jgi:cytochrome b6-f complex iron-sulfur subunit